MKKVPVKFRNSGYSYGLQYPWLYGQLGDGTWAVWHRRSGRIVYRVQLNPQLDKCLAMFEAEEICLVLNRIEKGPSLADLAAIDNTP